MALALTPTLFAYAGIVTLAVPVAACAPETDRRPAVLLAATLWISWLSFILSWTPYGLNRAVVWTGFERGPAMAMVDVSSTFNAGAALLALRLARFTWWGPLLFGLLFSATVNDAFYWLGVIEWEAFSRTADFTFLAEEAVFFVLGGPVCADLLARLFSVGRRHSDPHLSARREAETA